MNPEQGETRQEWDSLGEIDIPAHRYILQLGWETNCIINITIGDAAWVLSDREMAGLGG